MSALSKILGLNDEEIHRHKEERYTSAAIATCNKLRDLYPEGLREAVYQTMSSFMNPLDEELANKVLDKVMGRELSHPHKA